MDIQICAYCGGISRELSNFCVYCGGSLAEAPYRLAGYGRRALSSLLDALLVGICVPLGVVAGVALLWLGVSEWGWLDDSDYANGWFVLGLLFVVAWIGAFIGSAVGAIGISCNRRGQTPGKRLLGIRVITKAGAAPGRWSMLAREAGLKFLLITLSGFLFIQLALDLWLGRLWLGLRPELPPGVELPLRLTLELILWLTLELMLLLTLVVDFLWPLWDKNNQTLHDKIVGTLVVQVKN